MIEGTRIVTLAPSNEQVKVATFEEAFGEHSEFRFGHGQGRARRQERRLERIRRRRERHKERQENRREQQEARQERKDTRHSRKRKRKHDDSEQEREDNQAKDDSQSKDDRTNQTGDEQEQPQGSNDNSQDSGSSDNSSQQDNSNDSQDNSNDMQSNESSESGNSTDEQSAESSENFDSKNPHKTFERGTFNNGMFDNADGIEFSEAEGRKMNPHPEIQNFAHKIAWHKQMIKKYAKQRHHFQEEFQKAGKNHQKHLLAQLKEKIEVAQAQIEKHWESIKHLEQLMHKKFGEKHPHIPHAHKHAHERIQRHLERKKEHHEGLKTKEHHRHENHPTHTNHHATIVDGKLNPKFEHEKITIPAVSKKAEKKGHFDAKDGYYSTDTRVVDLFSNADGSTANTSHLLRNVLILGSVATLIYLASKHKVFSK